MYTIPHFKKFDDIFGERRNMRGVNENGDFCYIIPETARFYVYERKQRIDYQRKGEAIVKCITEKAIN